MAEATAIRPRRPQADPTSGKPVLSAVVTADTWTQVHAAAEAAGVTASTWIRFVLEASLRAELQALVEPAAE